MVETDWAAKAAALFQETEAAIGTNAARRVFLAVMPRGKPGRPENPALRNLREVIPEALEDDVTFGKSARAKARSLHAGGYGEDRHGPAAIARELRRWKQKRGEPPAK